MEIRNILVNLDPLGPASPILNFAVDLAARHDAKVTGFAAAEPWIELVAMEAGAALIAQYDEQRHQIDDAIALAEQKYNSEVPPAMRGGFRSLVAAPTQPLIDYALGADLIVLPALAGGRTEGAVKVDAGEVLLAAGRPVLLAASQAPRLDAAKIVVAWKDTREARRAVVDALPLLKAAAEVLVATVDEGDYSAERGELDEVMSWFKVHGIKARGDVLPEAETPASAIVAAAKAMGAGLVVSGAYGHTRLSERLFGGATRELLSAATVSRLLAN